jgi:hypothetical protein
MSPPFGNLAEERTVRVLGLITLIRLPLITVVLRAYSRRKPETWWTSLSTPIRYRLRRSSQRAGGSFDRGVHTLSACGGQGENAATATIILRHDNSRGFRCRNPGAHP